MKKILLFFVRLFLWMVSGFGCFDKRLEFTTGWDTLHPFAKFSFGGIERGDFLAFYEKQEGNNKLSTEEVDMATYNNVPPDREEFLKIHERQRRISRFFTSPFKTVTYT